ncbi:hypothetical protein HYU20_01025 [Candidatus Woesearchaeota archaeon]|nr:hypothetical protein [Candidatus Woesearchaeota archaeon]
MDWLPVAVVVVAVVFASGCAVVEEGMLAKDEQPQQIPQEEVMHQPWEELMGEDVPEEPTAEAVRPGIEDEFSHVGRPHWGHMPLTYSILNEEECGRYESNRVRRALAGITNVTGNVVSFRKANASEAADIEISCTFIEDCYKVTTDITDEYSVRYETICGHQLGVTGTTRLGSQIVKAEVELFGLAGFAETKREGPSGFYVGTCGHAITEVHEFLHAFGYPHSDDNSSIMYPSADTFSLVTQKEGACVGSDKEIDNAIVQDLIRTYSKG